LGFAAKPGERGAHLESNSPTDGSQALRMNLNALLRHDAITNPGIFGFAGTDNATIGYMASELAAPGTIARSCQFPYQ